MGFVAIGFFSLVFGVSELLGFRFRGFRVLELLGVGILGLQGFLDVIIRKSRFWHPDLPISLIHLNP